MNGLVQVVVTLGRHVTAEDVAADVARRLRVEAQKWQDIADRKDQP